MKVPFGEVFVFNHDNNQFIGVVVEDKADGLVVLPLSLLEAPGFSDDQFHPNFYNVKVKDFSLLPSELPRATYIRVGHFFNFLFTYRHIVKYSGRLSNNDINILKARYKIIS